jgi:pimeloyl-ACP methyl ester carboxylesterase
MYSKLARLLPLLLALCLAAGRPVPAAQAASPTLEPVACWFSLPPSETADCAYLTVPEDHANPAGPQIRMALAVVHSHSAAPLPDPVLFLNGGPGAAMLDSVPSAIQDLHFQLILSTRDVIFFDPRGVGHSEPALNCPNFAAAIPALAALDAGSPQHASLSGDLAAACRAQLDAAGLNVAAYTSAQTAADLTALRSALGLEQWNLFGVSYGTRLGLALLREDPAGARSAVLDSVYPVQANLYTDLLPNAERGFRAFFDGCAADLVCRLAYPDLEATFGRLVAQLEAEPAVVTVNVPGAPAPIEVRITAPLLLGGVFNALYSAYNTALVPGLIYDAAEGDFDFMAQLLAVGGLGVTDGTGVGLALAVQCGEDAPFSSLNAIAAARATLPPALRLVDAHSPLGGENAYRLCQRWGLGAPDPVEAEPVVSAVPSLLLAGANDPITPPAWARAAAATLSASYVFEAPGVGHGVLGGGDCPVGLIINFLNDPTHAPNSACLARMDPTPDYAIRARTTVPLMWVLLPLLSLSAAWAGVTVLRAAWPMRGRPFTWRYSLRRLGPVFFMANAVLVTLLVVLDVTGNMPMLNRLRVVETFVPLIVGLHAAYLFSPEDEPILELTLAAPRPLSWTVGERLACLLGGHSLIALVAGLAAARLTDESPVMSIVRWLPPTLLLAGLALSLTISRRQAVLSVGLVILLWFGMLWGGDGMLGQWPFLWPLHFFLQPAHPLYALNRAWLALAGFNLLVLSATYFLRDQERVLLGTGSIAHRRRPVTPGTPEEMAAQ